MVSPFQNSIFYKILKQKAEWQPPIAILGGVSGSKFLEQDAFEDKPIVVFDFETTGLNVRASRIIEMGAIKYLNRKEVDRFSTFVNPDTEISPIITKITGITQDMLVDAPSILDALPQFHNFLRGSIGVAHNAEFDLNMLHYESQRIGMQCDYTIICTLKMARALVNITKRNLDALAEHFELSFESRHRSIGDILVTAGVLWKIIDQNPNLKTIQDFAPYREVLQLTPAKDRIS